ncbi:MAG: tRNA pseudouridine(55) synthase TruB [Oscillospiraceae bacterium]|nr:tRNA pseudouridine(55) synthase TruB [Oscillospiraceae bacterium]
MKTGVILVNKPKGFTSFDVIAKMRGILKERRLGHSGTLDPMATGVLPVFVGKATKACDILPDNEKSYRAEFKLGFMTDTQDTTGTVTKTSNAKASEKEILAALEGFKGKISQLPPMYSAVQVGGKRLYDLARQGIEVEREPREIEVYEILLEEFDEADQSGVLFISCSKGTYIRTIINDLGEKLGTLGAMSELIRTSSQGFVLEDCLTLDEIQAAADEGRLDELIKPLDECFKAYAEIGLSEKQTQMYKNGIKLDASKVKGAESAGLYRVYGDEFLGLAEIKQGEDIIRVYKNFW